MHSVIVGMMNENEKDGVKMYIEKFDVNPKRDPNVFSNDLAIIKLASDIEWSERVKPICIGDQSHKINAGDQVSLSNYSIVFSANTCQLGSCHRLG